MRLTVKILIPSLIPLTMLGVALLYLVYELRVDGDVLLDTTIRVEEANRVARSLDELHQQIVEGLLSYRYDRDDTQLRLLSENEREMGSMLERLRSISDSSRGRELIKAYANSRKGLAAIQSELLESVRRDDDQLIQGVYTRWATKDRQMQARLDDLVAFHGIMLDDALQDIEYRRSRTGALAIGLTVFTFCAVLLSSFYYRRVIAFPLLSLAHVSRQITRGETQARAHSEERKDEIGQLARAFNQMADQLLAVNVELEHKVHERTFELAESNAALHANLEELHRMQESLLQSERLAAIGQMITGLSHESRNALQRSLAALEMLSKRVKDNEQAILLLDEARQAQKDLQQVYEGVRDYAGPINLERRSTSMRSAWKMAWEETSLLRQGRDVQLVEQIDGIDLACEIDEFRVAQIFRNLIENSIAACQDPVIITIRCADVNEKDSSYLRVDVCDNGPGLTPEQQARIFEPFFTTKTKGTGLGMSIVRRIVDAHGGQVWLEPDFGRGVTVTCIFPRRAPANQPSGAARSRHISTVKAEPHNAEA